MAVVRELLVVVGGRVWGAGGGRTGPGRRAAVGG
jgi:hypothetical protein